jgi:hypothetical protein
MFSRCPVPRAQSVLAGSVRRASMGSSRIHRNAWHAGNNQRPWDQKVQPRGRPQPARDGICLQVTALGTAASCSELQPAETGRYAQTRAKSCGPLQLEALRCCTTGLNSVLQLDGGQWSPLVVSGLRRRVNVSSSARARSGADAEDGEPLRFDALPAGPTKTVCGLGVSPPPRRQTLSCTPTRRLRAAAARASPRRGRPRRRRVRRTTATIGSWPPPAR